MTESEIHASDWWCPHCRKSVPPEMVTKDGEHYLEAGGCGHAVRGEPTHTAAEPTDELRWVVNGFLEWHEGNPCPAGLFERARAALATETGSRS